MRDEGLGTEHEYQNYSAELKKTTNERTDKK